MAFKKRITRKDRAAVYIVALAQSSSEIALSEAFSAAEARGFSYSVSRGMAEAAIRYAVACHGLRDLTCAQVATAVLLRGKIPQPKWIIRHAAKLDEKASRGDNRTLAERFGLDVESGSDDERAA